MIFIPTNATDYATATSYLTIAQADEIIESQKNSAAWSVLDDDVKEVILNQSSLAVDGVHSYQGEQTDSTQILKFPRDEAVAIPASIGYATALLCMKYANDEAFKGITSETIVKMSWDFAETKGGMGYEVLSFLRPLKMTSIKINQP